jgi:hypothetical protein
MRDDKHVQKIAGFRAASKRAMVYFKNEGPQFLSRAIANYKLRLLET